MLNRQILRHLFVITLVIISGWLVSGCTDTAPYNGSDSDRHDSQSFANVEEVAVTHLDLDIEVDFTQKEIRGVANLHIDNRGGADRLVLDTRDLTIERIVIDGNTNVKYSLGEPQEILGQPLEITLPPTAKVVSVYYHTGPNAAALQWLEPAQTAGKKHPFLFTQSQAILARTWVPIQDTPGIRITYAAQVQTDPELMAVMSARNPMEKSTSGIYQFEMNQPIPTYLLALAVGDFVYRPLGERSGVYAEPPVIEKAAYEFADTEMMIAAAEKLYGPYRWEKFDIIVLPPSFPYGGMENPRLTFATPTILAGDRSLVALIAHELAHSWSGNLVTNATWNDFWLNEGFTTYFEIRIMEEIYGKKYAEMLAQLSYQDGARAIEELGEDSPDTHLYIDLSGRDPDDVPSGAAYDKGRLFLTLIEQTVGREKWDAFLNDYFNTHAFQTMTTREFLTHLRKNLTNNDVNMEEELRIDEWVYGPGLPDNCPVPQSDEFVKVQAQIKTWEGGVTADELSAENWTTHHWLHFLRHLPAGMSAAQMGDLDGAFHFTKTGNSEILFAWLVHAIRNQYHPADAALENFLKTVGRRKFVKPLYKELAKTPEGLKRARNIYRNARAGYHPVTYLSVDEVLKQE